MSLPPRVGDPPKLPQNDPLEFTVTYINLEPNAAAPQLQCFIIVSASKRRKNPQTTPTPFRGKNSLLQCFWSDRNLKATNGLTNDKGQATYQVKIDAFTYKGKAEGKYELTVVLQVGAGEPGTGPQYSEDPEFDTGS